MAKVMVSLPDELLDAVDREATRRGTTRSALLRMFADESMRRRAQVRAARIRAAAGAARGHGGNVAELVKASRPQR